MGVATNVLIATAAYEAGKKADEARNKGEVNSACQSNGDCNGFECVANKCILGNKGNYCSYDRNCTSGLYCNNSICNEYQDIGGDCSVGRCKVGLVCDSGNKQCRQLNESEKNAQSKILMIIGIVFGVLILISLIVFLVMKFKKKKL